MIVEFEVELPEELIERGRALAAERGTTLEQMIVEHMTGVVEEQRRRG